jgi:hypothetical protein
VQRKKEAAQKQEHGLEISVALDKKHLVVRYAGMMAHT